MINKTLKKTDPLKVSKKVNNTRTLTTKKDNLKKEPIKKSVKKVKELENEVKEIDNNILEITKNISEITSTISELEKNNSEKENNFIANDTQNIDFGLVKERSYDPIYDTYSTYIFQAQRDYLMNFNHQDIVKIHQYVDRKTKRTTGLDTSCPRCVLKLLKLFASLKYK